MAPPPRHPNFPQLAAAYRNPLPPSKERPAQIAPATATREDAANDEALQIEGLAAQLYVQSVAGGKFTWWYAANDELKQEFREKAKARATFVQPGVRQPHTGGFEDWGGC